MIIKKRTISLILFVLMSFSVISFGKDSKATKLLKARSSEFDQEIIKVADGVYTAVGYSVSTVSMVVGEYGVIIVDTGMDTVSAEKVLADFRKITEMPIKAIILTHSHGDHTGGLSVFAGNSKP